MPRVVGDAQVAVGGEAQVPDFLKHRLEGLAVDADVEFTFDTQAGQRTQGLLTDGLTEIFLHGPVVDKIEVLTVGRVRRAKLYYLRDLSGKAARIKEKLG